MSTKMTEKDWVAVLEVFRASLPRRGDKGRDDPLFLEAMHYFSVHNISWRAFGVVYMVPVVLMIDLFRLGSGGWSIDLWLSRRLPE